MVASSRSGRGRAAQQVSWVSGPGDHAADQDGGAFVIPTQSWFYLSSLIVESSGAAGTVVAFGDSITDGVGSIAGTNTRWPDDLARRLDALDGPVLSVADEGIGGNRVLAGTRCRGVSAETRFRRDALDQPGVRDIILLEGINDIGSSAGRIGAARRSSAQPGSPGRPAGPVSLPAPRAGVPRTGDSSSNLVIPSTTSSTWFSRASRLGRQLTGRRYRGHPI